MLADVVRQAPPEEPVLQSGDTPFHLAPVIASVGTPVLGSLRRIAGPAHKTSSVRYPPSGATVEPELTQAPTNQ